MVHKDPRLITVRRSTVVRVAIVAAVLAALGGGIAIGLTVGSKPAPPTKPAASGVSTTTAHVSTTTSPLLTTTTVAVPAVLSCGPGSTPHVRPTKLTVGCPTGTSTVTDITWNAWDASTGGHGTGTFNVGFLSVPAIVVVFDDVNGVFQNVAITPSADVSTTSTTTPKTGPTTVPTSPLTTTPTTAGVAPVAATQPGSGWGGD